MKKLTTVAALAIALASCNSDSKTTTTAETKTVDSSMVTGTTYAVDSTSLVTWIGSKKVGSPHTGTFKISEGSVIVNGKAITGGTFTIDIASLNNQDLVSSPNDKAKLEGHLKSPDFFDVAKFPTSQFSITDVKPATDSAGGANYTISGNLTLKDSTKNVSFPAKITVDEKSVAAIAEFSIDRTEWGMNYKGPNNPQDWFIDKSVKIKLAINATKK